MNVLYMNHNKTQTFKWENKMTETFQMKRVTIRVDMKQTDGISHGFRLFIMFTLIMGAVMLETKKQNVFKFKVTHLMKLNAQDRRRVELHTLNQQ